MSEISRPKTLSEKLWDRHLVHEAPGEHDLLYIDLHLVHEVTSPQAFDGLAIGWPPGASPELTVATADHNVPTIQIDRPIEDPISATQFAALDAQLRCVRHPALSAGHPGQGIVHVIGPEQGLTLPGMTIVCGDSHTSTHGAFGALAFGIGTSEVEHVLATQTFAANASEDDGHHGRRRNCSPGSPPRTSFWRIIGKIGTGGGIGHVIEYRGSTIRVAVDGRPDDRLQYVDRGGAKAGMIAPDDTTFAYVEGRPHAPKGAHWEQALDDWRTLPTDEGAIVRPRGISRRRRDPAACLLGNQPGTGRAD